MRTRDTVENRGAAGAASGADGSNVRHDFARYLDMHSAI